MGGGPGVGFVGVRWGGGGVGGGGGGLLYIYIVYIYGLDRVQNLGPKSGVQFSGPSAKFWQSIKRSTEKFC